MRGFKQFIETLKIWQEPEDDPLKGKVTKGGRYRLKPGPLPPKMPREIPGVRDAEETTSSPAQYRMSKREKLQLADTLSKIRYKEQSGMPFIEMVLYGIQQLIDKGVPSITVWDKLKHGEYYSNPVLQKVLDMIAVDYGKLTVPQLERLVNLLNYTPATSADHASKLISTNGKLTNGIVSKLVGNTDAEWWRGE